MVQNTRGYLAALALTMAAVLSSVSIPIVAPARGAGEPGDAPGRRADQEALKPFASYVGDWRGTGQVERGRSKGAWVENANWAWKLTNDSGDKVASGIYIYLITVGNSGSYSGSGTKTTGKVVVIK